MSTHTIRGLKLRNGSNRRFLVVRVNYSRDDDGHAIPTTAITAKRSDSFVTASGHRKRLGGSASQFGGYFHIVFDTFRDEEVR